MRYTMSKPPTTPLLLLGLSFLGGLALTGCDAGKEPFVKAAQAEESGDYRGAAPLYEEVCTKKSPLCDAAKRRQARLAIKDAWKALQDGKYRDAKVTLDAAAAATDATTAEEAAALGANPDLVAGLAFEAALAATDKEEQRTAMEKLAKEPTALAPKAKEWLDKNRPAMLLGQAKAACAPGGAGSCAELAKRLAAAHPESPEAKEAASLAAESYKRLYPRIKDVENLLIQRVGVHARDAKLDLCKKSGMSEEDCAEKYAGKAPGLDYLEKFFNQKLALVEDAYYRSAFEKRWNAAAIGEYDPEPWAKP